MHKQLTVGSLIPGRTSSPVTTPAPHHTESTATPRLPARGQSAGRARTAANAQQASPLVRIRQRGREYEVRSVPAQTLLTAALSQGVPLAYKCLQGDCGRCTVQLLAGSLALREPGDKEREKLGDKLAQGYRLACQSSFPPSKQP